MHTALPSCIRDVHDACVHMRVRTDLLAILSLPHLLPSWPITPHIWPCMPCPPLSFSAPPSVALDASSQIHRPRVTNTDSCPDRSLREDTRCCSADCLRCLHRPRSRLTPRCGQRVSNICAECAPDGRRGQGKRNGGGERWERERKERLGHEWDVDGKVGEACTHTCVHRLRHRDTWTDTGTLASGRHAGRQPESTLTAFHRPGTGVSKKGDFERENGQWCLGAR